MFAESLLDSGWRDSTRRGWTTLASFALQAFGLGILLLLPLIYTQGLPKLKLISTLLAPPAPAPGPPPVRSAARTNAWTSPSNMIGEHLKSPSAIPHQIAQIDETNAPPLPNTGPGFGVPGGTGDRSGSVLNSIANSIPRAIPAPPVRRAPPSVMMEGNLVHKVQPEYPSMARARHAYKGRWCCGRLSAKMAVSQICASRAAIPYW